MPCSHCFSASDVHAVAAEVATLLLVAVVMVVRVEAEAVQAPPQVLTSLPSRALPAQLRKLERSPSPCNSAVRDSVSITYRSDSATESKHRDLIPESV